MRTLKVSVEIEGKKIPAGRLIGENYMDPVFCYDPDYLENPLARAISISLPLRKEAYSAEKTRRFFEGLLPEGFSRRAVADWAKVQEEDYLAILEKLGSECLGAIQIKDDNADELTIDNYKELSLDEVRKLAAEGAVKSTALLVETHLSLTGASGKVGLYYDEASGKWYLPIGQAASTHIVKQSHVRLQDIVTNEQFCMRTAEKLGISVPESFILNLGDGKDGEVLFVTKRYDRKARMSDSCANLLSPYRLHQEDFCQALGISSSEKYETRPGFYMKKMFELVRSYSSNPIEDQLRLWDIIIVNYLLGNTDCHLKNYSLLYSEDLRQIRLAPAYDIVCTRLYGGTNEMAFYIGGESDIDKMNRDTFCKAAGEAGIGTKLAMKHYDKLAMSLEQAICETAEEMQESGYAGVNIIKKYLLNRSGNILK